jgi:hypothetical protein
MSRSVRIALLANIASCMQALWWVQMALVLLLIDGRWEKIEQLGAVRIGNHVEIGANSCIDRGALEDTVDWRRRQTR